MKLRTDHDFSAFLCFCLSLLCPFVMPFLLFSSWLQSLWRSRMLFFGKWGHYLGYVGKSSSRSLSGFFYKTQWVNLDRYGRCGVSPHIGTGNYPLSRWFHLTLFSSFLYANAGAVCTLLGTLVWVFSHFLWFSVYPLWWVLLAILVLFFSCTAYAMAFSCQNYNILGWMFLPAGLFLVSTGHYFLASLFFLLVSCCSFTAVFFVSIILFFMAFVEGDYKVFLATFPMIFKIFTHALPFVYEGSWKESFLNTAKLIGLKTRGAKYKDEKRFFSLFNLYFFTLYALACLLLWKGTGFFPVYPVIALSLLVFNQSIRSFADFQSVVVFFVTIFMFSVVQSSENLYVLFSALIAFSPLPFTLEICSWKKVTIFPDVFVPFDHSGILNKVRYFLAPAKAGDKVLFAYNPPVGQVRLKAFDGYRTLNELLLFAASEREVHLFPDWYAVAETNYEGAPSFWGRSVEEVVKNMRFWSANYVVVYTDNGEDLGSEWLESFSPVSFLEWNEKDAFYYKLDFLKNSQSLRWWLLERMPGVSDDKTRSLRG